jgi:hypothetical protein
MAGNLQWSNGEGQRLLTVVMSERLTDGQIVLFNNVDVVYSLRGGVPGHVLPAASLAVPSHDTSASDSRVRK